LGRRSSLAKAQDFYRDLKRRMVVKGRVPDSLIEPKAGW